MTTINVHDPQQIVIGRIYRNGQGWRRDIEVRTAHGEYLEMTFYSDDRDKLKVHEAEWSGRLGEK